MKKGFTLYIRNAGDARAAITGEEHLAFVKKCEVYIQRLKAEDKLVVAQPIIREGFIISKNKEGWAKMKIDPTQEVQAGYYHIMANDMDEAIAIARDNPEFEFVPSASIEIRPIKVKEEQASFVYPK